MLQRHTKPFSVILISLMALMLSACASLTPYPQQAQSWKQQVSQGNAVAVANKVGAKKGQRNHLLYTLEAARMAQIGGDYQASLHWFGDAANTYAKEDAAARLRLSRGLQSGMALLSNDSALSYQSEPYERIFSETFQALNYLALDNPEAAAVEFRRADHSQRQQELAHQRQIAKAENEAANNPVNLDDYQGYFEGLDSAASLVRSSIQNAYSYYLAAAFWEATGAYNDALVDYKQALQIVPDAGFLRDDVQRVSAKLDGHVDASHGLVVVALEQGFVPAKQAIGIPIPTTQGIISVSFPIYSASQMTPPVPWRIDTASASTTTYPVARIDAMAARALKQKIPGMLLRQIARTTSKYALQKEANNRNDLLGLATQIYNLLSEQADLRSWLSLPANAQIGRILLPPGPQKIVLSGPAGNTELLVPVTAGGVTLVRAIQAGGQLTINTFPITQLSGESS